jgi:hypothetical protein
LFVAIRAVNQWYHSPASARASFGVSVLPFPSRCADVGEPRLNLARPFAVFGSREFDRHRPIFKRSSVRWFVQLGVRVAHVERDHLARDESALTRRRK